MRRDGLGSLRGEGRAHKYLACRYTSLTRRSIVAIVVLESEAVDRRVAACLRAVLPASAGLDIHPAADPGVFTAQLAGHAITVQWIGRGTVRAVRTTLAEASRPDVLVASEMSLAARAETSGAGVGWVDESGAAEIAMDGIVISRSGQARPRRTSGEQWTSATLGVAEAVLTGVPPTVAATAEATGYSVSTTTVALRTLSRLGHLSAPARRGRLSGRRVVDRDRLLDDYAEAADGTTKRTVLRCGLLWRDPWSSLSRVGTQWDKAGIGWAATGGLAAALIAPYLSDLASGDVYVDAANRPELLVIARTGGLEPIEGGRLALRPFPTAATRRLARPMGGIHVAPWPRVFADLRHTGVRGEEAAEHLREVLSGG